MCDRERIDHQNVMPRLTPPAWGLRVNRTFTRQFPRGVPWIARAPAFVATEATAYSGSITKGTPGELPVRRILCAPSILNRAIHGSAINRVW